MLKFLAHLISIVFHPLLIPTYMLILLMVINPYLFGMHDISEENSRELLLRTFINTFFIPAFAVMIMKMQGFITSFQMKNKSERTGPYIITGLFYIWHFQNIYDSSQVPLAFSSFVLGATIALFLAFLMNIFTKVSAHAAGMGGLLAMVVITMFQFSYTTFVVHFPMGSLQLNMTTVLFATIILTGIVGTARLVLKAHVPNDLYGGYLIGFVSQIFAFRLLF